MIGVVESITIEAGGVTLSGLTATPDSAPRLLVLALHGGGLRASYFDGGVDPDASFISLGSRLGYAVLALDRPGYGASAASLPDGLPLPDQAQVTAAAIDVFRTARGIDAPLFLLGHSMGAKLALELAADAELDSLTGVEFSGAGVRYNPALRSYPGRPSDVDGDPDLTMGERMELFWGSEALYPKGALDRENRPTAPVPPIEAHDATTWPAHLRELAPRVRVPVRYTVADHERWSDVRPSTLDEFASLFNASPRVEIAQQIDAGHNISLGRSARAYHLRVAAFAEECLLHRPAGAEGTNG